MDRRDFIKRSAGVMALLGLTPLLAHADNEDGDVFRVTSPDIGQRWFAFSEMIVGPTPVTVLQIDPKSPLAVEDLVLSFNDTPRDSTALFEVHRQRHRGGRSGRDVVPLDPRDKNPPFSAWSGGAATKAFSALFRVSLNTRASFRWVAAPGQEFVAFQPAEKIGVVVSCPVKTKCTVAAVARRLTHGPSIR